MLMIQLVAAGQNFRNQEGISLGGGISSLGKYSGFLRRMPETGISQYQAVSWEISFLRIRSLNQNIAFSHGISALMLGHSYHRERDRWINGSADTIWFGNNRQHRESYFLSLPFRWSFYMNSSPGGRFFLGPGLLLSLPVFEIIRIKGKDLNGTEQSVEKRDFPASGPYFFICPELETGYLMEFPDCSLARFSFFLNLRAPGIFREDLPYSLQSFSGLRFAWFFGNP